MTFLAEDLVIYAPSGESITCEPEEWCDLTTFMKIDGLDESGRMLPEDLRRHRQLRDSTDSDNLPMEFGEDVTTPWAEGLVEYSSSIPEKENIGEVIEGVEHRVDGKTFVVTTKGGWIDTDDNVILPWLEKGKDLIHKLASMCQRGPITVDLAERGIPEPKPKPEGKLLFLKGRSNDRQ